MQNQKDNTMSRNVGTHAYPVTFLHERAVALLYDELTRPADEGTAIKVRLTPGGDLSHDLREGVASVKIPGEWDQVGGIVPDLILYGEDSSKPLRIIEVVVSNYPDETKQVKLDTLVRRGVDVVVVKVTNPKDLETLCEGDRERIEFSAIGPKDHGGSARGRYDYQRHSDLERTVEDLIRAIQYCSPPLRRKLRDLLDQLDTLDSLYPSGRGTLSKVS